MLTIDTCSSSYIVSRDHPMPEKLRDRLDGIARRKLPAALADAFDGGAAQAPGLWFVRSLDVGLDIDAGWEDDEIARLWAQGIARSFDKATAEEGADALYFADRPAYLAAYLAHTAGRRAGQPWFFESFSGLSALPASAAMRTAVEEDPDAGWAALVRMERDELEKVLAGLTESDARRLLAVLGAHTTIPGDREFSLKEGAGTTVGARAAASRRDALVLLWETWSAPMRTLSEAGEALFHFLTASRAQSASPGPAPAEASIALTRLARRLRAEGSNAHSLLAALAGSDPADLYAAAGARDAETLRPLMDAPPGWIGNVGRALAASAQAAPSAVEDSSGAAVRYTPFGGAFLLLPLIDSLPDPDWPALGGLPGDMAIRFWVLVTSLGRDRFESVFLDPLLRDLFHIPPSLSIKETADWRRRLPPRRLAEFHRLLLQWQTETGLVDARSFFLAPLAGSPSAVTMDTESGAWIWLGGKRRKELARMNRLMPSKAKLICGDEELGREMREACPGRVVEAFDAGQPNEDEWSARLPQLAEDEAFLHPTGGEAASCLADRILQTAAQNVLRAFARSLPGFSRSGLEYLRRNFLDAVASVEDRPDRRIVRLSRPPLDVVLSMSGLNRRSFFVRRLDERPFELYPQE